MPARYCWVQKREPYPLKGGCTGITLCLPTVVCLYGVTWRMQCYFLFHFSSHNYIILDLKHFPLKLSFRSFIPYLIN